MATGRQALAGQGHAAGPQAGLPPHPQRHHVGQEPAELSSIGRFKPKVHHEHTVLIGVRNLDAHEKEIVRESQVHVFTMKDIDRQGMASIAEQALQLGGSGYRGHSRLCSTWTSAIPQLHQESGRR